VTPNLSSPRAGMPRSAPARRRRAGAGSPGRPRVSHGDACLWMGSMQPTGGAMPGSVISSGEASAGALPDDANPSTTVRGSRGPLILTPYRGTGSILAPCESEPLPPRPTSTNRRSATTSAPACSRVPRDRRTATATIRRRRWLWSVSSSAPRNSASRWMKRGVSPDCALPLAETASGRANSPPTSWSTSSAGLRTSVRSARRFAGLWRHAASPTLRRVRFWRRSAPPSRRSNAPTERTAHMTRHLVAAFLLSRPLLAAPRPSRCRLLFGRSVLQGRVHPLQALNGVADPGLGADHTRRQRPCRGQGIPG
jgi:hypothetical protein